MKIHRLPILILLVLGFRAQAGLEYPLAVGTQALFAATTTPMGGFPQHWRYELWVLDERKPGAFDAVWATYTGVGTPQETLAGAIPLVIAKNGAKQFPMEREATYPLHDQVESFVPTLPERFDKVWRGPPSVSGWYCSYQPLEVLPDRIRCSFAQYGVDKMDEVVGTETLGEIFFDSRYNWVVELRFSTTQRGPQGPVTLAQAHVKLQKVLQRDAKWAAQHKDEAKNFFNTIRKHDELLLKANEDLKAATLDLKPLFKLWQNFLADHTTSRFYRLAQNQLRVLQASVPTLQQLWQKRKQVIGSPAPPWTLKDTEGGSYSLQGFKDPILLLFWSRTNWWSLVAIRDIQKIQAQYQSQNLLVLPINVDATDAEAVQALKTMGAKLTTLRNVDPNLVLAYGIPLGAYPSTVLIDRHKKVADLRYGWGKQVVTELEKKIKEVL